MNSLEVEGITGGVVTNAEISIAFVPRRVF